VIGDPLNIENRPLYVQEQWLTRCAAGPRGTLEENRLVVRALRALDALRAYRTTFREVMAAAKPLAHGCTLPSEKEGK
jgi:hypothetical protein